MKSPDSSNQNIKLGEQEAYSHYVVVSSDGAVFRFPSWHLLLEKVGELPESGSVFKRGSEFCRIDAFRMFVTQMRAKRRLPLHRDFLAWQKGYGGILPMGNRAQKRVKTSAKTISLRLDSDYYSVLRDITKAYSEITGVECGVSQVLRSLIVSMINMPLENRTDLSLIERAIREVRGKTPCVVSMNEV